MVYLIKMNGKRQAVLCVLLSVMIGTCMFMLSTSTVEAIEERTGNYIVLDMSQYREGELIHREVIEDDYILRNYARMWLYLLSGKRMADAGVDYRMTDRVNSEKPWITSKFYVNEDEAEIRLGTGSTPVAVTDYKLQTEVLNQLVDDSSIWTSGNEFNVTYDTTIVSDGSYTITEAGISIDTVSSSDGFLMCRDVFSGISIVNGDVLVIRYIFRFNVGL